MIANGYAALVSYSTLAGSSTTARVTHCTHSRSPVCHGTWPVPGGGTGSGQVHGAEPYDVGHDVPVRLGPLGAYYGTGSMDSALLLAGIFDVVVIGAAVMLVRVTRRTAAASRSLEDEPGAHLLLRVGAGRATDLAGNVLADTGPAEGPDGMLVRPVGGPPFVLDRRDSGEGEPAATVVDTAGRPVGFLRRWHSRNAANVAVLDGANRQLGSAFPPPDAFSGAPYVFVLPDNEQVGRLSVSRAGTVLRLDRPVPEPLRTLLLALAFDLPRLLTTRQLRRGSLAGGRGWQDPR